MQDGLRNEFPYGKCQTVSAKLRIMNLKKVLDKMPQYLFLLKLAFSCQICALHLILVLLQAKTKFILVLELDTIIQVFTDMQAFRMSETISFGLKPIRSRICRSRFLAFLRFQLLPLRSIFRYLAMRRTSCTDIVLLFNDLTAASILWWICPVTSMINAKPCSL